MTNDDDKTCFFRDVPESEGQIKGGEDGGGEAAPKNGFIT